MVGKIQGKKGIERWKGIAWFLVKLNILAIPMWILLYFNITLPALQSFIAYLTFRIVSFLGYNISLSNFSLILVSGLNMLIIAIDTDCTAWKSMYFLAALSIATPAENRSRLKFLAIGLPLIFLINILMTNFI